MAVTATPIYAQSISSVVANLVHATGANTVVTLFTPGANGSKVESIALTNNDTIAYTAQFWVTISSTAYLIGSVTLPLSSGNTAAAPPVAVLTKANFPFLSLDANGNPYLYLASGAVLGFSTTVVVTSPQTVTGFVQAGNF